MGNLVDVPSALATIWQTPSVRRVGVLVRNVPQGEGRTTHAHLSNSYIQICTNHLEAFSSFRVWPWVLDSSFASSLLNRTSLALKSSFENRSLCSFSSMALYLLRETTGLGRKKKISSPWCDPRRLSRGGRRGGWSDTSGFIKIKSNCLNFWAFFFLIPF